MIFQSLVMILPRFSTLKDHINIKLSPKAKIKKICHEHDKRSVPSFIKIHVVQAVKKLNSISPLSY